MLQVLLEKKWGCFKFKLFLERWPLDSNFTMRKSISVQHGFRKRRSCDTQLLTIIDDLAKGIDDKAQTDVILLDYAKAFDKVSHRHLLLKVEHYGIKGPTLSWISDFLHNLTQQVLLDGQCSSSSKVSSGVPQGSVLGPLLFLIFINDLPDCVSNSTTRLFADDSVVYRRISPPADSIKLQQDLDSLQEWDTFLNCGHLKFFLLLPDLKIW